MGFIRILDLDLNLIAEIDNFESLEFQRSFYKSGNFTLTLNKNITYADELQLNRLIMVNNSTDKVGIIKQLRYTTIESQEMLEIKGWELKGIFKQRITIPEGGSSHQSFSNIEAETIIKDIVQRNCLDIAAEAFDNFVIIGDAARGAQFDYNVRYSNLEEALERIARQAELGTKLYLNFTTSKWDFDIVEGTDLTSSGGASNPVIFSTTYDNIKTQSYIISDLNSANYAYVGGQGEAELRAIVGVGAATTDVERYTIFVDARDLDSNPKLTARGESKLAGLASLESFECEILTESVYTYETSYNLGDYVTIQDAGLGVSLDRQLETITEFYNKYGFRITAGFGSDLKTVKEYIDSKLDDALVIV